LLIFLWNLNSFQKNLQTPTRQRSMERGTHLWQNKALSKQARQCSSISPLLRILTSKSAKILNQL
jgi:hypothetical protein